MNPNSIGPSQVYEIEYVELLRWSLAEKDSEIARLHVACTERFKEAEELHAQNVSLRAKLAAVERKRDTQIRSSAFLSEQTSRVDRDLAATRGVLRRVVEAAREISDNFPIIDRNYYGKLSPSEAPINSFLIARLRIVLGTLSDSALAAALGERP